ncbi:hypothetical protein VNO80_30130 [Phaseolus coccineus]|uniref:Uncharacterized protein n=1 Tax=Phaseolus coccineus TaxID=3886 RepID=A0AAN9QFI8_PHACN
MALSLLHVKLNCCSQQKLVQNLKFSAWCGLPRTFKLRWIRWPAEGDDASGGFGKGKRNGSVCLGGNEQGPLDQKG